MIVSLISNDKIDIPINVKHSLRFHTNYKVLSIYFKHGDSLNNFDVTVRVLNEDGVPGLYDIDLFEIIESNIDADFVCKKYDSGSFELIPESMSYIEFWDDFFNDDERALSIFKTRFKEFSDRFF